MIQLVRTVTLLVTAVALFLVITDYPLGGFFVGFGLLTYAAIVWKYPYAPVFLIPALLPILDFSPLTGRFFFNEFDILLLATVFLSACQKQGPPLPLVLPRGNSMLLYLFVLSSSIAIIKGAWPLHWPDINSFNNYYSGLNGLRSAKGCLWAIFFLPLLRREVAADASTVYRLFVYGMVGGVVLASSVVVAERLAFTGLLNYTNPYRVVGPFFEMHNGGAFIEGYFVVSLPFVAWFVVMQKQWPWRIIGLLIFLIGGYCMVVTYARGGYLAMMVAMTVLAFFSLKESAGSRSSTTILLMVMCFGLLAASAVPVLRNGGVMAGRFASSHGDLLSRAAQWQEALSMMGNSWIVK